MTKWVTSVAAAALLLASLIGPEGVSSQDQSPVVETASLLNQRFYPQRGGFLIQHITAAFVPEGAQAEAVFSRGGQAVETVPLRVERASQGQVFSYLEPAGRPGGVDLAEPGAYVLTVNVAGAAIGTLPFTLSRQESGDAFSPGATWSLDGPWPRLAFLSTEVGEDAPLLKAGLWASTRELGGERGRVRLVIRQGRREIATSTDVTVANEPWEMRTAQLRTSDRQWVRAGTLPNGRYALVLVAGERDVRSFPFTVSGGRVQGAPRGRLTHTPRSEMLLPRTLFQYGTSASEHELFWLEAG